MFEFNYVFRVSLLFFIFLDFGTYTHNNEKTHGFKIYYENIFHLPDILKLGLVLCMASINESLSEGILEKVWFYDIPFRTGPCQFLCYTCAIQLTS
jgi:hypothetical protein